VPGWFVRQVRGTITHAAHLAITGTGPGTVIELVGDQVPQRHRYSRSIRERATSPWSGSQSTHRQQRYRRADPRDRDRLRRLRGRQRTCSMPVSDVTVRDVRFAASAAATGVRKGDCIRLLGNTAATAVKRVTIMGSSFTSCARSGIGVQRNVFSLAVLGNHFGEQIGDTAFDSEATGGQFDDGLRLEGNSFADSTVNFSAAVSFLRHATITGNTFTGRGLSSIRTRHRGRR